MANLETLYIEIDGNASKASSGIDTLISSLSSLGSEIQKQIGSIKELASALKDIRSAASGGNIWKNLTPSTSAASRGIKQITKEATKASEAVERIVDFKPHSPEFYKKFNEENARREAERNAFAGIKYTTPFSQKETGLLRGFYGTRVSPQDGMTVKQFYDQLMKGNAFIPGMRDSAAQSYAKAVMEKFGEDADWRKSSHEMFGTIAKPEDISPTVEAVKTLNDTVQDTKPVEAVKTFNDAIQETKPNVSGYKNEIKQTATEAGKAAEKTRDLAKATQEVGKSAKTIKEAQKASHGLLATIGRIAKTMLIRTAIRALMKVAKQGLQNYYQYSKSINGAFATAANSIQIKLATTGNQIGAAIGSLVSALAPALNVIISLVNAAANALTMLFAFFGGSSTWSKATDGIKNLGGAAGGAGKQIRELLADFDELNVIASETGGGGGGGGGGGFGFEFEELQLPRWMEEWRPLLEALAAGTIGAIVLPKIWSWIKKIFGLGDGTGANTLKDILDKLLNGDDIDKKIKVDRTELDEANTKATELKTTLGEAATKASDIAIPSMTKQISEVGLYTAGIEAAGAAVDALADKLEKIKGAFSIIDLLKTLAGILITKLINPTFKIKIDREAYDKFVEEEKEWAEGGHNKVIRIEISNLEWFNFTARGISKWCQADESKSIMMAINNLEWFNFTATGISKWCQANEGKSIALAINNLEWFNFTASGISKWCQSDENKGIVLAIKNLEWFNYTASGVSKWTQADETKAVILSVKNLDWFNFTASGISKWCQAEENKTIVLKFKNLEQYNFTAIVISDWCKDDETKTITATISNLEEFNSSADGISEWCKNEDIKNVKIAIANLEWFNFTASGISTWCKAEEIKSVGVKFNEAYLLLYNVKKKEIENWINKEAIKNVGVKINIDYTEYNNAISLIADTTLDITIRIKVDKEDYDAFISDENQWTSSDLTKTIKIVVDSEPLKHYMKEMVEWLGEPYKKYISIEFESTAYSSYVLLSTEIDTWCGETSTKYISVEFDAIKYALYIAIVSMINAWTSVVSVKTIKLGVEDRSYTNFWNIASRVDEWVKATATKVVNLTFGNYDAFTKAANKITSWANQTLTKTINVVVNETTKKTTTTKNNNNSGVKWDFWNGLTNNGEPIVSWGDFTDITKKLFGFASGGFPSQGDLFIANERGAELVGSMGGRTAVANNQQIVEGISAGVRDANSEQNALLRRQNELLQRILEKDSSVRLGASAALGRTVKQSIDMYNTATGG